MTPTINMENPDPECDMDYVSNLGREKRINVAISNCISFGSKNSAIVLKKGTSSQLRIKAILRIASPPAQKTLANLNDDGALVRKKFLNFLGYGL
ncbi:MAG: hypothetical protein Ct9H300mP23_10320 [Nitrospinota bacterium]|nr:MAG: hypothetical protein Ct9H300mP23_10320 [Nitrospinota bacterium]